MLACAVVKQWKIIKDAIVICVQVSEILSQKIVLFKYLRIFKKVLQAKLSPDNW